MRSICSRTPFDPIDAACDPERQVYEFDILYDVLTGISTWRTRKRFAPSSIRFGRSFWIGTTPISARRNSRPRKKKLKDFYLSKVQG